MGGQQVNDALAQPCKKLRTVDRLGTVGFGLRVTVMDKHQVQVRTMPQFDPADLAVTDDDKTRIAQAAVHPLRRAVARHGLAPGQGQHLFENRLGQPGQVIADLHQRQAAGDFRSRDTQAVGQLEVAQGFHLLFEVILGNPRKALAQLCGELRCQRRLEQAAFIEQFVEQQRKAGDLFGDPRAGGAQRQQPAQGVRVFGQQHEVGRTAGDSLHQRQDALQYQVRVGVLDRLGQQARNKSIQPFAPQTLHGAQLRAATQAGQGLERFGRVSKATFGQLPAGGLFILGLFPQRQPLTTHNQFAFFAFFLVRVSDHLAEMPVHTATPVHQALMECRPIGKAQHKGNARLVFRAVREHLRLPVGNCLDGVFGVTQKLVAIAQLGDHGRWQVALAFQGPQHIEQRPLLQAQVAATMDQLERLRDKFHLADAARAQLDVVGHAFAPYFLLDQLLHGAQRFNGGKIQVPPIDEGSQHVEQLRTGHLITGHYPRLDHGVALPVAALVLVVLFQRIETEHQRAGRAIWPQAHVDTEHKTVDGHRVEGLDQFLTKPNEKLLVIQRALHAHCLAAFWVGEDQVDIRRQVQLHRAELAHAEDDHVLGFTAAPAGRRAELHAVALVQPLVGLIDTSVSHVGEVAAGLHQVRLSGQVAPNNAHLLARALAAQHTAQLIFCFGLLHSARDLAAQFAGREAPVQLAPGHQFEQHQRVTNALFNDEITGGAYPDKVGPPLRRPRRKAMIVVQRGHCVTK